MYFRLLRDRVMIFVLFCNLEGKLRIRRYDDEYYEFGFGMFLGFNIVDGVFLMVIFVIIYRFSKINFKF